MRVPHAGRAESLNLAAAATVCLFEWARAAAGRQRETLEALVAAAAHDIRSPLTAMKGFGYALEQAVGRHDRRPARPDAHRASSTTPTVWTRSFGSSSTPPGSMSGTFEPFAELVDVAELVRQIGEQQAPRPRAPADRVVGATGQGAARRRRG